MINKHFTALMMRLSLGFIYLSAGWSKLAKDYLGNIIGPVDMSRFTDSQVLLSSMDFIAIYQIVVGGLILSQKHSLLGLLLLVPLCLGILIFTILAGFGGTPIINLFLLILNIVALTIEKKSIQSIRKSNFSSLFNSEVSALYPKSEINRISTILLFILICGTLLPGYWLNAIATIYILLITLNLLQFKPVLFVDNIIFFLFFIICFITTNARLLNSLNPKAFYLVFYLILFGFILFFIRVVFFGIASRRQIEK